MDPACNAPSGNKYAALNETNSYGFLKSDRFPTVSTCVGMSARHRAPQPNALWRWVCKKPLLCLNVLEMI